MREIRDMHIIQIDVTNRCELRCSNCTRMLAHHPRRYDMTIEQFRRAVDSLAGFPGIIGVFGGNPTLHPDFAALCAVLANAVPKPRRGLWASRLNGHGRVIRETFGYFNLNVHGDAKAAAEIRRELPDVPVYGESDCWHKPSMVALRDVVPDPAKWQAIIDACPIQNRWSAIISPMPCGDLGAYPCEIMSAWEWVYEASSVEDLSPRWWQFELTEWAVLFRCYCPDCGLCLDLPARRDTDRRDDVSRLHAARAGARGVPFTDTIGPESLRERGDSLDYALCRTRPGERNLRP
ncbi:MAG TPA: radical SAM protein [Phycisphaerae bacterium]|nr:radical SAM protein [Phycisphaerae bacterium]